MGRTDEVQFMLECAAEWRRLGARVTFEAGWETRGNGTQGNYEGAIVHHTASASSAAKPNPTRTVLLNGRPDLQGPLCNVTGPWCADNDPWLHVIAAFPANHAGASGGKSMGPLPVTSLFNPRVLGLEIDYAGLTPMTGGQYKAASIFARGVTTVLKRSTEYVRAHAETSVTGKWDPGYASAKTIDMAAFRRDAAAVTPGEDDDFMALFKDIGEFQQAVNRAVLCMTPSDRQGAWLWDRMDYVGGQMSGPLGEFEGRTMVQGIKWATVEVLPGLVADAVAAELAAKPAVAATAQPAVDASAVAASLAANPTFLAAIAKAVNDDAARRGAA